MSLPFGLLEEIDDQQARKANRRQWLKKVPTVVRSI
jgi:hypothetical protein